MNIVVPCWKSRIRRQDVYKRQVKENLKPCVYKLWKHVKVQPRTFCRTVRRVADAGEVKEDVYKRQLS